MGAVKWTGKALKIVGDILTADEVEQWIENEGRKFLENRVKQLTLRAVFGKSRAKRAVRTDAQKEFEQGSGAFRIALQNSLEQFPLILVECAERIKNQDIKELYVEKTLDRVYVVPRDLASEAYQARIISEFKDSAQLRDFPGLIEKSLSNTSAKAEQAFFKSTGEKPGFVLARNYELLGCDDDFRWRSPSLAGHYYLGFDYVGSPDKRFREEISPSRDKLIDRIGRFTRDEHARVIDALYDKPTTA